MAYSAQHWIKPFEKLIEKYKNRKSVLNYKNLYQLTVMVVLAAQDSDAKINKLAPTLFAAFPNMKALAKASSSEIIEQISSVRGHVKKADWLQNIAQHVKADKNIPTTMDELVALKGIGRKSANVIMRGAGVKASGILVDLHVIRVARRVGITSETVGDKIEKDLLKVFPEKIWGDVGPSISMLGREICRPTNPKHSECVLRSVCDYCKHKNVDC